MPVSVIAFGAVYELAADWTTGFGRPQGKATPPRARLSFRLVEFAELDDGRRLELRADRGMNHGEPRIAYGPVDGTDERSPGPPRIPFDLSDPWQFVTRQSLTAEVLAYVDPDDEESWWRWLVDRLAELGVDVDMAAVRSVPYRVEFGPILDGELHRRGR